MPTTASRISLLPAQRWLERAGEQQPSIERERETPRFTAAASSIVIPAENTGVSGLAGAIKHLLARRGGTYFSLARGDQASPQPNDSAWRRSASSETEIPRGSHLGREKLLKKTYFFWKNKKITLPVLSNSKMRL